MIRYADLVEYIKEHHVNWNTDLFEVLRGFFEQYSQSQAPSPTLPVQQEIEWEVPEVPTAFVPPENGEYTSEDLLNLFST